VRRADKQGSCAGLARTPTGTLLSHAEALAGVLLRARTPRPVRFRALDACGAHMPRRGLREARARTPLRRRVHGSSARAPEQHHAGCASPPQDGAAADEDAWECALRRDAALCCCFYAHESR